MVMIYVDSADLINRDINGATADIQGMLSAYSANLQQKVMTLYNGGGTRTAPPEAMDAEPDVKRHKGPTTTAVALSGHLSTAQAAVTALVTPSWPMQQQQQLAALGEAAQALVAASVDNAAADDVIAAVQGCLLQCQSLGQQATCLAPADCRNFKLHLQELVQLAAAEDK